MSHDALRFERLEIRRALGIRDGEGFVLDDLAPGVNLVHGPNGSGKTTALLAAQEALWPGRTGLERPTLRARLAEDDAHWDVDLDAGHLVTCARDGVQAKAPQPSPPEARSRYRLALHELIAAEDSAFATTIVTESQGGFDLAGAARDLGFKVSRGAGRNESKEVVGQRARVQETRSLQERLDLEAAGLAGLREQRREAVAAQQEVEALSRSLEHAVAAGACAALETQLADLPPELARLKGDEAERLAAIDQSRASTEQAIRDARLERDRAKDELGAVKLPATGVDPQILRDLQAQQRQAQELETALARQRPELEEASAQERQGRQKLSTVLAPDRLSALQALHLAPLDELARQADRVRAEGAVLDERRRWLETRGAAPSPMGDEDRLRRGVAALQEWLASTSATGTEPSQTSWTGLAASAVLSVLGLILALVVHAAWALASLAGVVLLGMELASRRRRSPATPVGADPRAVHQQSYEATQLPAPERWEVAAVQDCVRSLIAGFASLELEKELAERRRELQPALEAHARQRAALEKTQQDIQSQLGVELELTPEWLPLFLDALATWQKAADAVGVATAELQRLERERDKRLAELARGLSVFGYPAPANALIADADLDDLRTRGEAFTRASDKVVQQERRIGDELEPALAKLTRDRDEVFTRAGLLPSQEDALARWLEARPEWTRLSKLLGEQQVVRDDHARALAGREDLLSLDQPALEEALTKARETAAKRDALLQEITTLEQDVARAKGGYDLTDALSDYAEAEARLDAAREQSGRAAVGAAICDWVHATAIEGARPKVFQRARDLLLAFTRGALVLEIDDRAQAPAFLARQGHEPARPVTHLSVGERVQLLMAVRLAFLEQDETVRLPLLLDEALGTSDDARAEAIIEAVKTIAASGRQVFYFTAQHDEVGKWLAQLGDAVPHRVFDLAELRRLAGASRAPLPITQVPRPAVATPDGLDYLAYGASLAVPPLDPRAARLDGLHLWHLLDDAATLYRLLDLGVTTWAQLQALLDHGGAGVLDSSDALLQRAWPVARAIEAAFEFWQIGKGRPVDRCALEDSDCVSETFIDRVAALNAEGRGDASTLLQGLEAGRVERWRQNNTASLREYFLDQGHLPAEAPLSPADLRVRVLAAVADDLRSQRLPRERLEQVLQAVGA